MRVFEDNVGTGDGCNLGQMHIDGEQQFLDYSGSALAIMGKDKYSSGSDSSSDGSQSKGYRIAIGADMNDGEIPISNTNQLDSTRGHVRFYI